MTDQAARRPHRQTDLRDLVYGAIDGSVTTFAIVAGVAGAGLPPHVIVALGLANVVADGFSMAAGNYAGTKAERDDARRLRRAETARIADTPEAERAALRDVLAVQGLSGEVLRGAVEQIAQNREAWLRTILRGGYDLRASEPQPMRAALATFVAFLAAGMLPLLPFLLGLPEAFALSTAATLLTFFAIGTLKSRWSLTPWWRSGAETLAIGGAAATLAWWVGTAFS